MIADLILAADPAPTGGTAILTQALSLFVKWLFIIEGVGVVCGVRRVVAG